MSQGITVLQATDKLRAMMQVLFPAATVAIRTVSDFDAHIPTVASSNNVSVSVIYTGAEGSANKVSTQRSVSVWRTSSWDVVVAGYTIDSPSDQIGLINKLESIDGYPTAAISGMPSFSVQSTTEIAIGAIGCNVTVLRVTMMLPSIQDTSSPEFRWGN